MVKVVVLLLPLSLSKKKDGPSPFRGSQQRWTHSRVAHLHILGDSPSKDEAAAKIRYCSLRAVCSSFLFFSLKADAILAVSHANPRLISLLNTNLIMKYFKELTT